MRDKEGREMQPGELISSCYTLGDDGGGAASTYVQSAECTLELFPGHGVLITIQVNTDYATISCERVACLILGLRFKI